MACLPALGETSPGDANGMFQTSSYQTKCKVSFVYCHQVCQHWHIKMHEYYAKTYTIRPHTLYCEILPAFSVDESELLQVTADPRLSLWRSVFQEFMISLSDALADKKLRFQRILRIIAIRTFEEARVDRSMCGDEAGTRRHHVEGQKPGMSQRSLVCNAIFHAVRKTCVFFLSVQANLRNRVLWLAFLLNSAVIGRTLHRIN